MVWFGDKPTLFHRGTGRENTIIFLTTYDSLTVIKLEEQNED